MRRWPTPFEMLSLPVYGYYWVIGLSFIFGGSSTYLGYTNIDHPTIAKNWLAPVLPDAIAVWLYTYRYEVAIASLLLMTIATVKRLTWEKSKWAVIIEQMQPIREKLFQLRDLLDEPRQMTDMQLRQLVFSELTAVASATSHIMNEYTGTHDCHVSIKLMGRNGEVSTATRSQDVESFTRSDIDDVLRKFNYKENTAFERIIEKKPRAFFCSNNLVPRYLVGLYTNKNPNWWRRYWATIVVPITAERTAQNINLKTTVGFLCVDNIDGGFDRKTCKQLLSLLASQCVEIMVRVSKRIR